MASINTCVWVIVKFMFSLSFIGMGSIAIWHLYLQI
jgi:hypothetical protein